jgi:hypothetical protein
MKLRGIARLASAAAAWTGSRFWPVVLAVLPAIIAACNNSNGGSGY